MHRLSLHIVLFFLLGDILFGCKGLEQYNVRYVVNDSGDTLYICDLHNIEETITIELSAFVNDLKIVQLENSDSAIVAPWRYNVTDNYVGISNEHMAPFKLFNHNGDYICDIGNIGHGPDEYSSTYGIAMNEKEDLICLASPFCKSILYYNFKGEYLKSVNIGIPLFKPVFKFYNEQSLILTHIPLDNSLVQHILVKDDIEFLKSNSKIKFLNSDGGYVGFNHEIWSYTNVGAFNYQISAFDTLYTFNLNNNRSYPRFTVENNNSFIKYNELSDVFLFDVYNDEDAESYIMYKKDLKVFKLNLINDFCGNITIKEPTKHFNDGWYGEILEPLDFVEKISSKIKKIDRIKTVNMLLTNIDKSGNCIMLIGKQK